MERIVFRALLLSILPLVTLLTLLYFLINSRNFVDLITIKEYNKLCGEYIYQEMIKQESREIYGMIEIMFGEEKIVLPTAFYENNIINKDNILLFFSELPWSKLITENHFDYSKIKQIALNQYKNYINSLEQIYNTLILSEQRILDAKINALDVLYNAINSLSLSYKDKTYFSSCRFREYIISSIDWPDYVKTIDFQSGQFMQLKFFYYGEILRLKEKLACIPVTEKYSWSDIAKQALEMVEMILPFYGITKTNLHCEMKNFLQGLLENKNRRYILTDYYLRTLIRISLDFLDGYYLEKIIRFYFLVKEEKRDQKFLQNTLERFLAWWRK